MTMEMILALGILVLMIVLIMEDKMPFGAWRTKCLLAPTATACVFIAGCIGTFDRSTGFCRIRQSKRGDDCRVYGGHGGATKNPAYQQR